MAQSGQGGGQVERSLDGTQRVVGDRVYELVELAGLQEANAPVWRARLLGAIYVRDRIGQHPAALEREGEDAVQEVQVVLDRLARQAVRALALEVGGDPGRVDPVDRRIAEESFEVST